MSRAARLSRRAVAVVAIGGVEENAKTRRQLEELQDRFDLLDARQNLQDLRLDAIDARIDALEGRVLALEEP